MTDGDAAEAVLGLARTVRGALTERTAAAQVALDSYDEAIHGRAEEAGAFLRVVVQADEAYERTVGRAFHEYRMLIENG